MRTVRNMMDEMSDLDEKKMSYESQSKVVGNKLKGAISDLKTAMDNVESADAVVFNVATAMAALAGAIKGVSKGHGGKLTRMVGDINGVASDLSTKGRQIVKASQ